MAKTMASNDPSVLNVEFLEEYSSQDSIRRYTKRTAGSGINYLLNHEYNAIYLDVIEHHIPKSRIQKGLRVWEFGCGGGMNLLHLVSALEARGIPVECAIGTDFSEALIAAAKREAKAYLKPEQIEKVRFCVASHESLVPQTAQELGTSQEALLGSFDIMLGVNTMRYAHRLNLQNEIAGTIRDLLNDTGVCIVIDMNSGFPAFRSRLSDRISKAPEAYYLPTLEEHARPFSAGGWKVLQKRNFCWIPHSAGAALTRTMRLLTPVLNTLVPNRAMRSLVIAQKAA